MALLQVLKGLVRLGLRTQVTADALLDAALALHDAAEPGGEHTARAAALLHLLNTFAAQGEALQERLSDGSSHFYM